MGRIFAVFDTKESGRKSARVRRKVVAERRTRSAARIGAPTALKMAQWRCDQFGRYAGAGGEYDNALAQSNTRYSNRRCHARRSGKNPAAVQTPYLTMVRAGTVTWKSPIWHSQTTTSGGSLYFPVLASSARELAVAATIVVPHPRRDTMMSKRDRLAVKGAHSGNAWPGTSTTAALLTSRPDSGMLNE